MWLKEVISSSASLVVELAGGLCFISVLVKYHHNVIVWAFDVSPLYVEVDCG